MRSARTISLWSSFASIWASLIPESDDAEAGTEELNRLRGEDAAEFWRCAYDDCGGTRIDAVPWVEVRQAHPEYPETPQRDKAYYYEGLE